MTNYVGGLRLRLIKESYFNMVKDGLTDLGWFESGRGHLPVSIIPEQADNSVELKANIIGVSTEDIFSEEAEIGSNLSKNSWEAFIDILAEDEAVGIHLAGDIRDLLSGKISSVGRTRPNLEVKDLAPSNNIAFTCSLENIEMQRVRDWDSGSYARYWWIVACEIVDHYYDDQE